MVEYKIAKLTASLWKVWMALQSSNKDGRISTAIIAHILWINPTPGIQFMQLSPIHLFPGDRVMPGR
jgi:hypothetical protein